MKLALAQVKAKRGDVSHNIQNHLHWINSAASQNVDAVFFPELSITGYEPGLSRDLGFTVDDIQLNVFQEQSDAGDIVIGLGIPLIQDQERQISMIIFQPNRPRTVYSKQLLHEDELPYFIPGTKQVCIVVKHVTIAPAICYESLQQSHFEHAIKSGCNLYLASVAKPQQGVDKANAHFPIMSKTHSIPILMVNSIGFCDNFDSAGQSGVWDVTGTKVWSLDAHNEGLLIFDIDTKQASTQSRL
jgi:predicted amidohydrolase